MCCLPHTPSLAVLPGPVPVPWGPFLKYTPHTRALSRGCLGEGGLWEGLISESWCQPWPWRAASGGFWNLRGDSGARGGILTLRVGFWSSGWDSGASRGILELGVGFWSLGGDSGAQGGILEPGVGFWSLRGDSGARGGILELGVGFWSLWWDSGTQGGILMPRMDFWSPGWDSRSGLFIIKRVSAPLLVDMGPRMQ